MMHECDDCKLGDKSPGKTYTELTDLLRIAWEMERSATEGKGEYRAPYLNTKNISFIIDKQGFNDCHLQSLCGSKLETLGDNGV